ncbi:MAG: hypothetical protein QOH06_5517 [Acidobacteriota bacterium]|jgi:WD40 repeat protein/cellulose biosynthesis protein BcsQ|nr:hypothetical protein [Acidobacteriota bacterium]
MALINVAWILASNGKRVLVLDWDLEAPGLHRYLAPFLADKDLTVSDGIIDFVHKFITAAATPPAAESPSAIQDRDWYRPYANILRYATSIQGKFEGSGTLDFIPAGRQGPSYSTRVNSFNWQFFYDRLGGGTLLEIAKEKMRAEYDFILIDSRTGVSDTSGICTVQMPDTLVICFTLNNQSIEGAAAVAQSVLEQRAAPGKGISIFPVAMRIENAEKVKLRLRNEFARQKLREFPNSVTPDQRDEYWGAVPVLYIPYYAYEEILACFGDNPSDRISILAACEQLTSYLTSGEVRKLKPPPEEERQRVLREYEGGSLDPKAELGRFAESVLSRLPAEEKEQVRYLFSRLVRVGRPDELGGDKLIQVRVAEVEPAAAQMIDTLVRAGLLAHERDGAGRDFIQATGPELLESWPRLQEWIASERDFLSWREQLHEKSLDWQEEERDDAFLLRGSRLDVAADWYESQRSRLSESENRYIEKSLRKAGRSLTGVTAPPPRLRKVGLAAVAGLLLALVIVTGVRFSGTRIDPLQTLDTRSGTWSFSEDRSLVAWTPARKEGKGYIWSLSEPWSRRIAMPFPFERVAISKQGTYIAGFTKNGSIYVWPSRKRLTKEAKPAPVKISSPLLLQFGFSPDERWFVAKSIDGLVIGSVNSNTPTWTEQSDQGLRQLRFSPKGHFIARQVLGGWSVFRPAEFTGKRTKRNINSSAMSGSIAFSNDERWLAFTGEDQYLYIADLSAYPRVRLIERFHPKTSDVFSFWVLFSPDNRLIFASTGSDKHYVWRVGTGKKELVSQAIGQPVDFDPSGRWALATDSKSVYLLEMNRSPSKSVKPILSAEEEESGGIIAKFSPLGNWAAAGLRDLFIWKVGSRPNSAHPRERLIEGVEALRWCADDSHLFAFGGSDISFGTAGGRWERLERQPSQVRDIAITPDRRRVIVFGASHLSFFEQRFYLWNIPFSKREWPELVRDHD